jgi:hypothetical protein
MPHGLRRNWRLAAVAIFALAAPSAAQQGFVPVDGGFSESIDTTRPVSARNVMAGLSLVSAATHAQKRRARQHLWVMCREDCAGTIEVIASTASGRYEGRGRLSGAAAAGQWVKLPLPPAPRVVASARQAVPDDQIATIAWAIDPRGVPVGNRPLLTAWTETDTPPVGDTVQLTLGGDADMAVRVGNQPPVPCRPTSARNPTGFSKVCLIPRAAVGADGRLAILRVVGTSRQTIPFQLH